MSLGQNVLFNEFIQRTTDRAKAEWALIDQTPLLGAAKTALIVERLVKFVIQWSMDKYIGGSVPVLILSRQDGIRWFRRPEFCPEN